jgi:hypothetical protein
MSKTIEGYDAYEITEEGDVFSNKGTKPRLLKPQPASQSKKGYLQVRLYDNSGKLGRLQYVHRLVYTHFVGEILEGLEIDHIDGNPRNNTLTNLQLLSRRDNTDKYNRKKQGGSILRDKRDELIKDYEILGTFKKVAKKWGVSITAVNRVVRNRVHTILDTGKYGTRTYDENIKDEWSL